MVVQLSVRVDAGFRERLRQTAARDGQTVQDFVVEALSEALERRAQRGRRAHADLRRRLADALDDGTYAEYVDAVDDPDLRTV